MRHSPARQSTHDLIKVSIATSCCRRQLRHFMAEAGGDSLFQYFNCPDLRGLITDLCETSGIFIQHGPGQSYPIARRVLDVELSGFQETVPFCVFRSGDRLAAFS